MALHLGRPLTVDACLEALWPHLDMQAAARNLRVTLHWVRKALGEELVRYADGQVALAPEQTWCDVAEFRRLLDEADQLW